MADLSLKIQEGRVKNVHVGNKLTNGKRTGEIKPLDGNLMDVKFITEIKVDLGDVVEFRKRDGRSAEILKIIRKAK